MTTQFFESIESMRVYVKMNASLPWETFKPYLDSAVDSFTDRYLPGDFIDAHTSDATFLTLCRKVLAPLAVYEAADEMSISIGDSGITVQNDQGKRSPASDAKIAAAKRNLLQRSNAALSRLLEYVLTTFHDGLENLPLIKKVEGLAVPSLEVFERYVSLDSDYVAYFSLVTMLRTIQNRLGTMIGEDLLADCLTSEDEAKKAIGGKIRAYCAYQCAYLNTSDMTRRERGRGNQTEWRPLIRPLYSDLTETGNWYKQVADETLTEIQSMIDALDGKTDNEAGGAHPIHGRHTFMM
jgi:hypothetical protein